MLSLLRSSKLLCTPHKPIPIPIPLPLPLQCAIFSLLSSLAPSSDATKTKKNAPTKRQVLERYLVKSCEFSQSQAVTAAKKIPCRTPLSNPRSVVQFLKQNRLLDAEQIRTAVVRDPRLLVLDVEGSLKPTVSALEKLGFSLSDVNKFVCLYPSAFSCSDLEQRIEFWIQIIGSVEKLFGLLKKNPDVLIADLDQVVVPNLHVFQKKCLLSGTQIIEISMLLTKNPKNVKEIVKRAMEFGVPTSLPQFRQILLACVQKAQNIKSKIQSLISVGLSEVEVLSMIGKQPTLLTISAKTLQCKVNFLTREVDIDPTIIVRNPSILLFSMHKKLVPRHHVMMKLKAACLPDGGESFYGALLLSEQNFLDKFVFRNINIIPDLYSSYSAVAGMKMPTKKGPDNQSKLLKAFGFSESEISNIIRKFPAFVTKSEEQMQETIDFLLLHVGLDCSYIAAYPKILTYSLVQRLIPRYYVMKCLELKGLFLHRSIINFMELKELHFVEQCIRPYEHIIQGLADNYNSARAGRALEFKHKSHKDQEAQASRSPK